MLTVRTTAQGQYRVNDESQRCAARDIERKVGADIDPGQAHDRNGAHGEGAARLAEPGERGGAQGHGDASVSRQVPEPSGFAAADVSPRKQDSWPGPPHNPLGDL